MPSPGRNGRRSRAAESSRRRRDARWRRRADEQPEADREPDHGRGRYGRPAATPLMVCGPQIDEIEGEDFALHRTGGFPCRHVPLPAAPDRREDRLRVAAVDPDIVGQVGRTDSMLALAVLAVAGGAIGGERPPLPASRLCAGIASPPRDWTRSGHKRRRSRRRPRGSIWSRPKASICDDPRVGMGGVDADPDGLGDRLGSPPHSQDAVVRFGKPLPPLASRAVAGRAIVAEQRRGRSRGRSPSARDRPGSA